MKIKLVSFANKYFNGNLSSERAAVELLNFHSVFIDSILVLSIDDAEGFKSVLNGEFDALFIVGAAKCTFGLESVLGELGLTLSDGICNTNKFIALIDENLTEQTIEPKILALQEYAKVYHGKTVFKTFGLTKEKIDEVTSEISAKYPTAFFHTETKGLDGKTVLVYDNSAPKIEVDKAIKEFLYAFKNNVYAEDDITLEYRLNELLRLRGRTVSTAESMTGGAIAAKIITVKGASDLIYEGLVTYNTTAKETRLGVEHKTVQTCGVVSSEVAYEMAKGILQTGRVNSAISITGLAEENAENPSMSGLCYIGIGLDDSVEVFKYNFSGTRKEIIDSATNAALFLMIKSIMNV